MADEEKTTVEETKTVEEEKTEAEETEAEEKTVEETKTEPVKEVPDAKEETKLSGGDGTKTGTDPGFTYDEVMDFIERHDLPKGLALGDTLNLRLETVTEHGAYDATHIEKSNICVVGTGAVTEADYDEGHIPPKSEKTAYAMCVGDGVAGTTRYENTEIRESEVVRVYRYYDSCVWIGDDEMPPHTYFGLMSLLYLLEKEIESGGGKKAKAGEDEDSDGYFEVSGVGYATPYRDRPNMHVSIAAKYPSSLSNAGGSGSGGLNI